MRNLQLSVSSEQLSKVTKQIKQLKFVFLGHLLTFAGIASRQIIETLHSYSLISISYDSFYLPFTISEYIFSLLVLVTLGYALLTRRLYDVRVVIRRGLQYLLARNVLRLFLLFPFLTLTYQVLSQPDQTIRQLLFTQPVTLTLIALAALGLIFRKPLRTWLDRRFFREQYQQEQVLYRLIDEIGAYEDLPALWRRVEQVLGETLHPVNTRFFLRQPPARDLLALPVAAANASDASNKRLSEGSALYQMLKETTEPVVVPLPRGWALPAVEMRRLQAWGASLLVPLQDSQAQLIGLLMLGEKRSEEPYSPTDRRLLATVAKQMATVYEVAHLRGQVSQKTHTEHTVLSRLAADEINLLRECSQCGRCYDLARENCDQCNLELALTLPIERTLEGRYRLEQRIGQGGMGAVYRAADVSLRRDVAVKIIKAECFGDAQLLRRFEREAQAAARLDHPNVVRVYDYGRTPTGGAWLVMELLRGLTLREMLNEHGRLTPQAALPFIEQLLSGLNAAHQAGIVHRDLKPENLLLNELDADEVQLKILDFGLAKLLPMAQSFSASSATLPGLLMGTVAYMAPEQLAGSPITESVDIYATGLLIVESLTGVRPAEVAQVPSLLSEQQSTFAIQQPAFQTLCAILQKCLMPDAQQRYASVAALQKDLLPVLAALR